MLPYVALVLLGGFFVVTAVAAFLAQRVLSGFGGRENLMTSVAVGVVGTAVATRVPVVGTVVLVALTVVGTGAAALAVVSWRRERRAVEAAAGQAAALTSSPAAEITPVVQTSPAARDAAGVPSQPPEAPDIPAPASDTGEPAEEAADAPRAEEPAPDVGGQVQADPRSTPS